MNETNETEKSYWDEWMEEAKKMALVWDGKNYWTAQLMENIHEGDGPVFEMKKKLKEGNGGFRINGKSYYITEEAK